MADGDGFDLCECIFSQEFALRRLVSLLRNSQAYCTDTECYQDQLKYKSATHLGNKSATCANTKLPIQCVTSFVVAIVASIAITMVIVPGPPSPTNGTDFNMWLFTVAWVIVAAVLFLMRPSSLRNSGDDKPGRGSPPGGNPPPDAPVH